MSTEKDIINPISHDLLQDATSLEPKRLSAMIDRIKLSPEAHALGEEMRESILDNLNRRIDRVLHRSFWLKASAIAASIALLLGITNYYSYLEGYKQLNSQLVRMTNPLGMKPSIVLSDGTCVMLNAGTTITYPTAFVGSNRTVEVSGEAFFEVTHNSHRPFIVKAENVRVRVYGTQFNVKSYTEEPEIEITLTEGSVGIGVNDQADLLRIKPGHQAIFDKKQGILTDRKVDLKQYTAWKEGKYYFKKQTFDAIARQLERSHNVHIEIATTRLKNTHFTGDFIRGENLEQILRVMTADQRIKYQIKGDQVRIYEP